MNDKRDKIMRLKTHVAHVEAMVNRVARLQYGEEFVKDCILLREELEDADRAVKALMRKPSDVCHVQGCFRLSAAKHVVDPNEMTTVALCEVHSATSKYPELPAILEDDDD